MEETNTILGGFDCDGGDECEGSLARSAAFVLDVKPESDVHSILPSQRSPLENNGFHVVYILSRFIHMLFLFAVVSAGLSQWVFNAYKTRETL